MKSIMGSMLSLVLIRNISQHRIYHNRSSNPSNLNIGYTIIDLIKGVSNEKLGLNIDREELSEDLGIKSHHQEYGFNI